MIVETTPAAIRRREILRALAAKEREARHSICGDLDPYRYGDPEAAVLRRHISALNTDLCHEIATQPVKILFREGSAPELLRPPEPAFRKQALALRDSMTEELRRYEGWRR